MVCAPCPQGTYSDGGSYSTTLCERCPIGSTTPGDTTESSDDCSICQSGFAGSPPEEKCKVSVGVFGVEKRRGFRSSIGQPGFG